MPSRDREQGAGRAARRRPRLSKRFGQHHLVDAALCRPLIAYLAPAGATVVEIGPGGGVLTGALLAAGAARLVACEVDLGWACHLRRALDHPRLQLLAADALTLPFERLPAGSLVAGNLPFNVAMPILRRVLAAGPARVPRAGFMVQKEVALRLVARPGSADYGALSVLVQARAEPTLLGTVKAGSFRPPPKVAAAFVGFAARTPPLAVDALAAFETFVRALFSQRRKTLRNGLGRYAGRARAAAALAAAGIDPAVRAETLELDALVALFRALREG